MILYYFRFILKNLKHSISLQIFVLFYHLYTSINTRTLLQLFWFKQSIFLLYSFYYYSQCSLFHCADPDFISACRTPFNIYGSLSLLVINSFSLCIPENFFILSLFGRQIFFQCFKDVAKIFYPKTHFMWILLLPHLCSSLHNICFSPGCLKYFLLPRLV